jgi:DNA-binding CsgD family transcriptional regulator
MLNGKSYSEISREYKINRRYVSETITPVKNEIRQKLNHLWEQTF